MALSFYQIESTKTTITMQVGGLQSQSGIKRKFEWFLGDKSIGNTIVTGPNVTYTYTGLAFGTQYSVSFVVYFGENYSESLPSVSGSGSTLSLPKKWNWDTNSNRKKAKKAIDTKGPLADFSYLVWNEMCDKISEVHNFAGHGHWSAGYEGMTYEKTIMTADDKKMTANRFNGLKYQIGSVIGSFNNVNPGDSINGSYFIKLMNRLNEWIDLLGQG